MISKYLTQFIISNIKCDTEYLAGAEPLRRAGLSAAAETLLWLYSVSLSMSYGWWVARADALHAIFSVIQHATFYDSASAVTIAGVNLSSHVSRRSFARLQIASV